MAFMNKLENKSHGDSDKCFLWNIFHELTDNCTHLPINPWKIGAASWFLQNW